MTTPEPLRAELRALTRARLLNRLAAIRPAVARIPSSGNAACPSRCRSPRASADARGAPACPRDRASRAKLAPQLLDQPGIGTLLAAQVMLSWSHRGRLPTEAAFARLAGVAPIPASSGQTIRYRLDRSGDRKLNRALHLILADRRRSHRPTIDYIERRLQEGKTRREATRCLKRYLARSPTAYWRTRRCRLDKHRSIAGPARGPGNCQSHPEKQRRRLSPPSPCLCTQSDKETGMPC